MRYLRLGFLLAGIALLAVIVHETDLTEAGRLVAAMGWGMFAVCGVYFVAFLLDTVSWQIALPAVALDGRWLRRLWVVRMIGEAFNSVLPAGTVGGEPVKVVLLKQQYDVGYRDATASLILTRTVNLIALIVFLAVGLVLVLVEARLSAAFKTVAALGLGAFSLMILGFFLVQRLRLSSAMVGWAMRWPAMGRLAGALAHIEDVDAQFVRFYASSRGRFVAALTLAFFNWLLGALELYIALDFLGRPVTFGEAWMIEAAAQLVRAGTFFIPGSLGAQDGAFVLLCTAITGSPALGVAAALVRRMREVLWIAWGFGLLWATRRSRSATPPAHPSG